MSNKKKINEINDFVKNNSNLSTKSVAYQIGYKYFGILLAGYSQWLEKNFKDNNINSILFLARDGFIMKQAYEILYPERETKYLYVSRKSLTLPTIYNCTTAKEIIDTLVLPPLFTIEIFLNCLGLSDKEFDYNKYDMIPGQEFKRSGFKNNDKLLKIIENNKKEIKLNSKRQYDNFMAYFSEFNTEKKIAVIDIGWHNSIQKNLVKILKDKVLYGYYVGVYDDANVFEKPNKSTGFLFNYGDNLSRQIKLFSFVSLFESLFLSHEGTTILYENKQKKCEPILAEYEYANDNDSLKTISEIQVGALDFVKDYKNNFKNNFILNSEISSYNIIKFGCNPNKIELRELETLNFENYNLSNIINFNKSNFYYFTHPKKMISDFYRSGWRIMFLRKLFIIPLNYNFIFKIICKIFKR